MMKPILVWNPNPTLDVVSEVHRIELGRVHRAERQEFGPGGKGTLVIRTLVALGVDCLGVAPIAGETGAIVQALFEEQGLPIQTSPVSGWTRAAVSVVDQIQRADTVVNGPGPVVDDDAWDSHIDTVQRQIDGGRFGTFVVAGRPPPSDGDAGFAHLCCRANASGLRVVLDVASPVLERALTIRPWLVKINRDEARAVVGPGGFGREEDEAGRLRQLGATGAIVTDGPNAIRIQIGDARFTALPPAVRLQSAVGCGDCFLGGLLRGLRDHPDDLENSIRWAAAVASAAAETLQPGSFSVKRAEDLRAHVEVYGSSNFSPPAS